MSTSKNNGCRTQASGGAPDPPNAHKGAVVTDHRTGPATADRPSLKPNAIGFFDALVIGLASTSPAYTIAAIIGGLVLYTGVRPTHEQFERAVAFART